MAEKNTILKQKNTGGEYENIYPRTNASVAMLSAETKALFGNGITDADAAMRKIANAIKGIGNVNVKVVDQSGNAIPGATVKGLSNDPKTDADGLAHGAVQNTTLTIISPFEDLQDTTASVTGYVGSLDVLQVTLQRVTENTIKRYTASKNVRFSKQVKNVDVCCVGAGGAGAAGVASPGGGGGGIVNGAAISVEYNEDYGIVIGAGGTTSVGDGSGGDGGSTSFAGIVANGGGGGFTEYYQGQLVKRAGKAGLVGCGDGGLNSNGGGNTTISEFNDNLTYYSGGGASGTTATGSMYTGGSPNGANGAYLELITTGKSVVAASSAGIGGGGGGGTYDAQWGRGKASDGGSGLVAIRFHF